MAVAFWPFGFLTKDRLSKGREEGSCRGGRAVWFLRCCLGLASRSFGVVLAAVVSGWGRGIIC